MVAKRTLNGSLCIYITIVLLPRPLPIFGCTTVMQYLVNPWRNSLTLSQKKSDIMQQKSERVTMVKKSDWHSKIVTVDMYDTGNLTSNKANYKN